MKDYRELFISKIRESSNEDKYTRQNLATLNLDELRRLSEELSSK